MNFLQPVFWAALLFTGIYIKPEYAVFESKQDCTNLSFFETVSDSIVPDTSNKIIDNSFSWTDTLTESPNRKFVIKYTKQIDKPIVRDTIQIIDIAAEVVDSTQKEQIRALRKKSVYNVAVVLPFMTNVYGGKEIPAQSVRAVEFYEGIEIAFDSLRKEGISLKVNVFDSKKDSAGIAAVIEKMNGTEWDLIIGPAHTEVLKQLATFAKEKEVPLVSPFNNSAEISEDNHYYIQVNPSYEVMAMHIAAIMTNAKPKNPGIRRTKYLILGTSEDSLKMEQIQNAYALYQNNDSLDIPKLISTEAISVASIQKYFDRAALNIVVIPNEKNEQFIYSSLREISTLYNKVEKANSYQILVVGEPSWKYLERVNFEYYDNLRLHIPDYFYVDKEDNKNKAFEEAYRDRYGIAPREFAYLGFDIMLYFGRLLNKYGTAFPDHFEKEQRKVRHTIFDFVPVYKDVKSIDATDRKAQRIMRFENQYLNLIKFEEYDFKSAGLKLD